ncbi:MAG: hypothetical protein GKS06_20260 [Acidobacteria bacterium]|nr:hypothetical protein [Acidobacteriota bacterium]
MENTRGSFVISHRTAPNGAAGTQIDAIDIAGSLSSTANGWYLRHGRRPAQHMYWHSDGQVALVADTNWAQEFLFEYVTCP